MTKESGYSKLAIWGFITSFCIPIVGLILSVLALSATSKGDLRGRGLAKAGLVISIILLVLVVLFISSLIALMVALFS